MIAILPAPDDMQMQVDFCRREFGPGVFRQRRHLRSGYCPLRTAPEWPVFSLASSLVASSGVGLSVRARRH